MTIHVLALIPVESGETAAFVAAATACAAASRAEAGVLRYELWREADGDRRFVFDEVYADDAAVERQMKSDHFRTFELASRRLAGPPTVIKSRAVDIG